MAPYQCCRKSLHIVRNMKDGFCNEIVLILVSSATTYLGAHLSLQDLHLLCQTLLGEEILSEVPGGGPALVTAHLRHGAVRQAQGGAQQQQDLEQHQQRIGNVDCVDSFIIS